MLIMYVVYCVVLSFNSSLERWAKSLNIPFLPKDEEPAEQSALVTYRSLQEERVSYTAPTNATTAPVPVDPWNSPVGQLKVDNEYNFNLFDKIFKTGCNN